MLAPVLLLGPAAGGLAKTTVPPLVVANELPPAQAVEGPSQRTLWPGETFDAEFAPSVPGTYRLRMIGRRGAVAYDRVVRVQP